jgi:predicted GH43/DUF377 family glycosyl hydrolase
LTKRILENPIITPEMVEPTAPNMEVIGAFNPGAAVYQDHVVLLLRVAERPVPDNHDEVGVPMLDLESGSGQLKVINFPRHSPRTNLSDPRAVTYNGQTYLSSISHLRLARSHDGTHFKVEKTPALFPTTIYEEYGIEDCRITPIDGTYYISYTAVSRYGICVGLASTTDFQSYKRHGLILHHENKNVTIFPRRIEGLYMMAHRTASAFNGPNMWISYSPDLLHWGDHRMLMSPRPDRWDARRIGAGAPPIETTEGWLMVYHGVNPKDGYCAGVALLDLEDPTRVRHRSEEALLAPEEDYEVSGFFERVVFPTGLVLIQNGSMMLYYGVADRSVAAAQTSVEDLIACARNTMLEYA